ncbi:hypothetical protein [Mycolicibacterium sp. A43C]
MTKEARSQVSSPRGRDRLCATVASGTHDITVHATLGAVWTDDSVLERI